MKTKRLGFTLSEVLLVLSVIGVVAALTIPTLINSVSKDQYASRLKKTYSTLSQAYNMIIIDNSGSILNDNNFNSQLLNDAATDAKAMNEFATKLNTLKNCGNNNGCWYTTPLNNLGGTNYKTNLETYWSGWGGRAILADGTIMGVDIHGYSCAYNVTGMTSPLANSVCGVIHVDLNGPVVPNTMGRDFFAFWITPTGLYPYGTFGDGYSCNTTSVDAATSLGCTARVLQEGAMSY